MGINKHIPPGYYLRFGFVARERCAERVVPAMNEILCLFSIACEDNDHGSLLVHCTIGVQFCGCRAKEPLHV